MPLRYTGTFDDLKKTLSALASQGEWKTLNQNQHQFKHKNEGVLNWYPSTKLIHFQGKPEGELELQSLVEAILTPKTATTEAIKEEQKTKSIEEHIATTPFVAKLAEYTDSDLIIGLVGAIGSEMSTVIDVIKDRLKIAGYEATDIQISKSIIPKIIKTQPTYPSECARFNALMDAGNEARRATGNNAILADGAAEEMQKIRKAHPTKRRAFIINSLKHPEEVMRLRQVYHGGFYLLGVHPDEDVRMAYMKRKGIKDHEITSLIERDQDDRKKFGQRVNDTFHMSDFFIRLGNQKLELQYSIERIVDILFGDPYKTPTFDEYCMFLAFTSSLRSADLSRQVGAVVSKNDEILAMGANDCPKFGGGLYWPKLNQKSHKIEDSEDGRDYMRGQDSNKIEQQKIIDGILEKAAELGMEREKISQALSGSRIKDLTEYGRVVHAEMDALLSCARNNVSTRNAELFCTTFPCHNCAKHIVAAGIKRVVYIEPYQKSKAIEFHTDSISVGFTPSPNTVHFEPFVGIGPRRFFDLFSIRLGAGYELKRKDDDGLAIAWSLSPASKLRMQMLPGSFLDLEAEAGSRFNSQKQN